MILTKLQSGVTVATIEADTHIGRWVIESGRLDHDQNTLPHLTAHIPEGGTVVDIGAYIGDHTHFYATQVGSSGKVWAFEPNPDAFACLAHNMAQHPHVNILNAGASDRAHTIGIAKSANAGASHAISQGSIPCLTIDSLNIDRCDFIKLDCEGMEPRALRGALNTIMRHRPVMLIEVNREALRRQGFTQDAIFDLLDQLGYTRGNIYAEQKMDGEQFDILCRP